ncbi:glycoside hydrolase [Thozetella sp. PMI_491]|nr:glycoside hydrolase [Thozetella sp. PMI_491]
MLMSLTAALVGALGQVAAAQNFASDIHYGEVLDTLQLGSRTVQAAAGFNYSDPDVVDEELRRWQETANHAGAAAATWAVFPDLSHLTACNKTMLLDFSIHTDASDPDTGNPIYACTADSASTAHSLKQASIAQWIPAQEVEIKAPVYLASSGNRQVDSSSQALATAGREVSSYLSQVKPAQDKAALGFGLAGNALIGVYSGAQAHRQGISSQLLDQVISDIVTNGVAETLVVELCQHDSERAADYVIGIAASTQKDGLDFVQRAVRQWSNASCIASPFASEAWAQVSLRVPAIIDGVLAYNQTSNQTHPSRRSLQAMEKRDTCRYITVVMGDGCGSLASKCGISGNELTKYNAASNLCSTLQPGQPVCCSSGDLPDLRPKTNSDGTCFTYTIQTNDDCSSIAARNMLTVNDIDVLNNNTWGWTGCDVPIYPNVIICLSPGYPPMPAPVDNAICGPTVPGTVRPTDGTNLTLLNPCPLNVCCNVWAQCGLSDDFCLVSPSKTGAPGTSALHNGWDPPATEFRVGYFEAWNAERPCLRMHANQIDTSAYTHVHFAFVNLTEDFKPDVSSVQDEFDLFKSLTGVKRIVSFGGWAFSTSAGTWPIFKNAVLPANRNTFKNNVLKFVNDNGLDGADFDWEYPAAPDIDGVPPGDLVEGVNYLKFLATMKAAMPSDKTVSFAAPASYWYLKQFPISFIAETVDYITYMTYDLHGQWDYGNQWATPGCDSGNCLRSHVNATETLLSLAMITKAGVNTNKVVVGVSSYGRSFHMAEAGCTSPDCKFTGSRIQSDAAKGDCTGTAGYISNAEIEDIISRGGNIKTWSENSTDYLVYNDLEWVAYMSDITKSARQVLYSLYNFAGTTDWAIDLQSFDGDAYYDNPGDMDDPPAVTCDATYSSLDNVQNDKDKIPEDCMAAYVMEGLAAELEKGIADYDDIMKTDYGTKFGYFADAEQHTDEFFNCLQAKNTDTPGVYKNESIACPPHYISGQAFNLYLIPKDTDALAKFLDSEYSIDIDWTYGSSIEIAPCIQNDCDQWGHMIGSLALKPDFSVPDPKDSIAKSIDNIRSLPDYFRDTADFMKVFFTDGDPSDAVDGATVPVYMIQQAVQSMHDIYKAGADIQKEKMKNLIITCITGFLFILPGLGEVLAGLTDLAMIARIATMVSEVGGIATGAYDLATNKDNLAVGIFSFLLGFVGLKGALKGTWSDAAALRRQMTTDEIAGMGDIVKSGLEKVGSLSKSLCQVPID